MADQKISQLTAATTPLGGTEVLPVVQSSVTKQVSVANLTAGRAVSMSTLAVGVASPATTGEVSGAPGIFRISGTGGTVPQLQLSSGGVVNWSLRTNQNGASDFSIYQDSTERFLFASGGNLTVNTGNLVIGTSGKGIDFSANTHAAGMTSEVLTWYEEGTWTPADASGAGLSLTIPYARYTRIGRQVTVACQITYPGTASALAAKISGLPFAASGSSNGIASIINSGAITITALLNSTNIYLRTPINVDVTNANMNGVNFYMTATYFV